jgi:putative N-acetylmannosamine-6-phosphate epimerase
VPIIGLTKHQYPDGRVLITASVGDALDLVNAGADVIAVDATTRVRPQGITGTELVRQLKQELEVPVMADVDTLEAGVQAAEAGADYIATTLSGYTPATEVLSSNNAPDLEIIRQLAQAVTVPIIAEGRIRTPAQARHALDAGAYGVVVGSAITRPEDITRWFVQALAAQP